MVFINSPKSTIPATRIVGVGASAGGLAPLEAFLGNVPPHSGLAYVLVQHLDPTHKAMLSEILQRTTAMPVREAQQNMRITPDCVYVIPPNTELSILNDTLLLRTPAAPPGKRLPINVLFSSLASARGELAIAVVLSGMGSDGTLGLQAVKAAGGLTVVQQTDTAQFDAMPLSAIAADCGDIIAPPQELPARILKYINATHNPAMSVSVGDQADPSQESEPLQRILDLLQHRTRHDFSLYKSSTLHRRIDRRMVIHAIDKLEDYADFMQVNPQEADMLFREVLIGVTSFFRDAAPWEHLAKVVLPELLDRHTTNHALRAWVIGCSTGEEAYSLAIVFREVIRQRQKYNNFTLQIFATDLSPGAIETARRGRYPASISDTVSKQRLTQFFNTCDDGYQIKPEIRDMLLFAEQDVILDPPFTKLNLISCRNLLIYFQTTLQRSLIPLFHYSLLESGVLLLGTAETVNQSDNLFKPIEGNLHFYQRLNNGAKRRNLILKTFPPLTAKENPVPPPDHSSNDNLQAAANQVMLQVYAPAAVLINGKGDIVYTNGRTGKYLEPAVGKANWNIHAMAREGLRAAINVALKKSTSKSPAQHLQDLIVQLPDGDEQGVDITVQTLHQPAALQDLTMIVFRDSALLAPEKSKLKDKPMANTPHEPKLQEYHNEIQALREQARASREELHLANEELQSTNEELQSTNEELTTSKEEMQSMNEELQTINSEMQTKLDELMLAQSDMSNVLNSIEIAILFLDQNLNVRRYTDRLTKIINIRESDVGRPFSDLTSKLKYPELQEDAIETLRTLKFCEKQIKTIEDRWFSIKIMPYRQLDNVIGGLVITFVDITLTKELELSLRQDLKS